MIRTVRRVAVLFVVFASLLPPSARANCGAESCPLAPQGPDVALGRFSFDVGYQFIEQDRFWDENHRISEEEALEEEGGIGHIVEQLTRTSSVTANARVHVMDRLMLTASVPYIDRVHRHALAHHAGFFVPAEYRIKGVGDASVLANWTVFSGATPTSGALSLQLGVKLPTGERHVDAIDDEEPEPPVRPGSGSTDGLFGMRYVQPFAAHTLTGGLEATIPVSVGVSARVNGRGTDDYRSGNEWLVNAGTAYPVTRNVQVLGQLNFSSHEKDEVGDTDAEPHHTGSNALFAAPGLRVNVFPGLSAYGYYQFRLYQHTNGPQLIAPYHLAFGLGYSINP